MSDRRFTFVFGSVDLTESEVWPDNDGPENPTAEDVAEVNRDGHYSLESLVSEWNLEPGLVIVGVPGGDTAQVFR